MKFYRFLLAAFFLVATFSSLSVSAQDDREDVVYLKNGSIYRGIIVEQVPGESINIETIGGNVFHVVIGDIVKITKEKKVLPATPAPAPAPQETYGRDRFYSHYHHAMCDSSGKREFHFRKRGYFNTVQVLFDNLEGGVRMVNGYKFGRLGYLGIGIGADFLFKDMHGHADYSGVYLPLYLHYGGDILKRRITPFYSIEAGYAMRLNPNNNNDFMGSGNIFTTNSNITSVKGGLMGGVGFGVKLYSRHKIFISLSAHANFKQAENTYAAYTYDPSGNYHTTSYKTHSNVMIPGLRLGIGF